MVSSAHGPGDNIILQNYQVIVKLWRLYFLQIERQKMKYQVIATFDVRGDVECGIIEAASYIDALQTLKENEKYYLQEAQWRAGIFNVKPGRLKLREVQNEK